MCRPDSTRLPAVCIPGRERKRIVLTEGCQRLCCRKRGVIDVCSIFPKRPPKKTTFFDLRSQLTKKTVLFQNSNNIYHLSRFPFSVSCQMLTIFTLWWKKFLCQSFHLQHQNDMHSLNYHNFSTVFRINELTTFSFCGDNGQSESASLCFSEVLHRNTKLLFSAFKLSWTIVKWANSQKVTVKKTFIRFNLKYFS